MAARYTPKEWSKQGFGKRQPSGAQAAAQRAAAQAKHRVVTAAMAAAAAANVPRGVNPAQRGLQLGQGEFKSVDVTNSVDCNTGTAVLLLNGIARGDEIFERNGREVIMKSIQVALRAAGTAATGIGQSCRVLFVYDRQTNAAALTAAQVLTAADTLAPRNLENRRRFKILYDRLFDLPSRITATVSGPEKVHDKFYRRLRHPITFNSGDAGTVADITTGSLYAVVIGDVVAGDTDASVTLYSRIRYQDL